MYICTCTHLRQQPEGENDIDDNIYIHDDIEQAYIYT